MPRVDKIESRNLHGQDLELRPDAPPEELAMASDFPTDDEFMTAKETACLLEIEETEVTSQIEDNQIVGFEFVDGTVRIPRDQFEDDRTVNGVPEVLAFFKTVNADGKETSDHQSAWDFLASTFYAGDPAPRPIDRLRAASRGQTKAVVDELIRLKRSLDYGDHV